MEVIGNTSPWRTTPHLSVFLLSAVFCVFAVIGFANDILQMGREQPMGLAIGVVGTGLFAVAYAFSGISLRNKFWFAFFPLLVLQLAMFTVASRYFPNLPNHAQFSPSDLAHLQSRLTLDALSIIVSVALGYAGFVIVFIREGRRYIRAQAEKAILDSEMAAAREVQQVILPGSAESFPGFTIESVYRPAQQVGGDFFQILPIGSSGLLIVLGDVAGKGLPAAMLVSMLVGSIRTLAEQTHDPALILHKLHDRLIGRTHGGFSTALAALIADDGLVTIANAGHLSPYLDGKEIELRGAFPLGIVSGARYESTSFQLHPGSRLTFYSDGVVEAQNKEGELFGFDRAQAISQEPAESIVQSAVEFGQSDDITVVIIERLSADAISDTA